MSAWVFTAIATGDSMSAEAILIISAITSGFLLVGGLAVGLPVAALAKRLGWDRSGLAFIVLGCLSGGIAAYALTLLFFIDGLDVGFAMAKITVWFGIFAGFIAAICWRYTASFASSPARGERLESAHHV